LYKELENFASLKRWLLLENEIKAYIKTRRKVYLNELLKVNEEKESLIQETLIFHSTYYNNKEYLRNPKWDRVFVTTLFTFYWKKLLKLLKQLNILLRM